MIDTDKYEGHTEGPWNWDFFCLYNAIGKELVQVLGEPCDVELVGEDWDDDTPTQQLIADAPLLLEEVKRLREQLRLAKEWVANEYPSCLSTMDIFTEYIGDEEE